MMESDCKDTVDDTNVSSNESGYVQLENDDYNSDIDSDYPSSTSASRDQVFCNSLVWRNLEKCLNFADLKCLRLVGREFNRNIMEETNFKSRVLIHMQAFRVEQEIFKPTTLWKHFKIECFSDQDLYEDLSDDDDDGEEHSETGSSSDPFNENALVSDLQGLLVGVDEDVEEHKLNLDWICGLLKGAESLTIITICNSDNGMDPTILPSLRGLLEAPDKLKSLSLDVQTIDRNYRGIFKSISDRLHETFQNLTQFHILPSKKYLEDKYEEVEEFEKSLFLLSTTMKNLKTFTVPKFLNEDNYSGAKFIHMVMEVNKAHLTTLEVSEPHMWSAVLSPGYPPPGANMALQLQQLKSLKIVIHHANEMKQKNSRLIGFIKAQPLERLELAVSPKFPSELCSLISTMGNLKVLRLKTKGFDAQELHSWSFLNKLERLEEFDFVLGKSNRTSCRGMDVFSILVNLPKSTSRIRIKGIPNGNVEDINQPFVIDGITKFHPLHITDLSLSQCGAFVTDRIMECICRNFRMLRKLDVSKNRHLTDFGFTGIRPDNVLDLSQSSFSIKDLKGLRFLGLQRLEITDLTLEEAVQFIELKHLDLAYCNKITNSGCVAVIRNNPSLEILITDQNFSSELLAKYPRLKKPANLDDDEDNMYHSEDDLSDSDVSLDDFDDYDYYDSDGYAYGGESDDDDFGFHFRFGYDNDYNMDAHLDFDEW